MKLIMRGYGVGMTLDQRQSARTQAADMVRTRGTGRSPGAPRDVFTQSGPRGVLLNWRLPAGFSDDITGFRVYKDDETKLYAEVDDPNTTQYFVAVSAGSTPPTVNFFVSAVNQLGQESAKIPVQGSAAVEAGAPTMPVTPPTYIVRDVGGNPRIRSEEQL